MQRSSVAISITIRAARPADAVYIQALLEAEDLDGSAFVIENFVVAEDALGSFAGCARLKPYADCVELSSVAVHPPYRGHGVGHSLVATLLRRQNLPGVYLVCEPKEVPFFQRFGFVVLSRSNVPPALEPKLRAYEAKVGVMLAMQRADGLTS